MRASYVFFLSLFAVCAACVGTIFWSLNPTIVTDLETKIDLSDAILSAIILLLLAAIPERELD